MWQYSTQFYSYGPVAALDALDGDQISPPGLTRLPCRVTRVASSLPVVLGPEQPFLPLLRLGLHPCLDLRLPFGLHRSFGDSGSLSGLLALRFGGLFFRTSCCFLSANGRRSLLNLCLLASSMAGGPFRQHRRLDRRSGLVFRECGAPGAGCRLLTLLKSWILKFGHA